MLGGTRVSGLIIAAALLGACSSGAPGTSVPVFPDPGNGSAGFAEPGGAAGASAGGAAPGFGGLGIDFGVSEENPRCPVMQDGAPIFAAQVFDPTRPAQRELFAWTSDEQAVALRRDRVLFTEGEYDAGNSARPIDALYSIYANPPSAQAAPLALALTSQFVRRRYAWPEPWPMRMGWPGEERGHQLLRVVLKPEAWIAVIEQHALRVVDLDNHDVSHVFANGNPGRIAAVYYINDEQMGGPSCTAGFGSGGYREFMLGNEAMVDEWSLGTQLIRDRLSANIDQLTRFLPHARACPATNNTTAFNLGAVCSWGSPEEATFNDTYAYLRVLAVPSTNYLVAPEPIVTLIDTLQGDLFEPDPVIVTSGGLP